APVRRRSFTSCVEFRYCNLRFGGLMLSHGGWGPETPIEAREYFYSLVRKLRREGGAQEILSSTDPRAGEFVEILGGPDKLEFPAGGRIILSTCDRLEVYQGTGGVAKNT